jgi:hypothetical protein
MLSINHIHKNYIILYIKIIQRRGMYFWTLSLPLSKQDVKKLWSPNRIVAVITKQLLQHLCRAYSLHIVLQALAQTTNFWQSVFYGIGGWKAKSSPKILPLKLSLSQLNSVRIITIYILKAYPSIHVSVYQAVYFQKVSNSNFVCTSCFPIHVTYPSYF